jgi:hypothetical protein
MLRKLAADISLDSMWEDKDRCCTHSFQIGSGIAWEHSNMDSTCRYYIDTV